MAQSIKINVYEYVKTRRIKELEAFNRIKAFKLRIEYVRGSYIESSGVTIPLIMHHLDSAIKGAKGFDVYATPIY